MFTFTSTFKFVFVFVLEFVLDLLLVFKCPSFSFRLEDEASKLLHRALSDCENAFYMLDEESMQSFSAVGSTIGEIQTQISDIQVKLHKERCVLNSPIGI